MANNPQTPNHDFLQQLLDMQTYAAAASGGDGGGGGGAPMMVELNSGLGGFNGPSLFPLGLSLDGNHGPGPGLGFLKPVEGSKRFTDDNSNNNNNSNNTQHHIVVNGGVNSGPNNIFHGQPTSNSAPVGLHQPAVRPRVRARRGQATDPHSIAERLRRERIAERIRALQELVPSVNKTDRAAMLDEIVDYVKFLRLQVKVLSMSRLGGAGAIVPLVSDMPISSIEEEGGEGQPVWEKWSNDGTERQVAKLMEENVGEAMQFLQSKALCIMPISLASAIYHIQPPDSASMVKPESIPPL